MNQERGYCLSCPEELCHLDDSPNGARNATCARCRAEESHDFDREPQAIFSRSGERLDDKPKRRSMPESLSSVLANLPQLPQRQDSTADQLADLHVFANRLGLYDAADVIRKIANKD